jgi:RNA polymerase sigma-70 factor, ECF subfamily
VRRDIDRERLGDHLDRLYRAAWGLCGSREDAEDLVQETYARVLGRPRLLRRDDDLGYLLRTLRNVFIDTRRAGARRPATVPLPGDQVLGDARGGRTAELVLEATAVFDAIAALPDPFREVIVAVDLVGLSYREAAALLGVREGTIMSRLHRARERVVAAVG